MTSAAARIADLEMQLSAAHSRIAQFEAAGCNIRPQENYVSSARRLQVNDSQGKNATLLNHPFSIHRKVEKIPAAEPPQQPLVGNSSQTPTGNSSACVPTQYLNSNLMELLPSKPDANMKLHDGRCSRRYTSMESAWAACMVEAACTGVVRDNGLDCVGARPRNRMQHGSHQFELRSGALQLGSGLAWTCPQRLEAFEKAAAQVTTLVSPNASAALADDREGYMFIVLGACPRPKLDCTFLEEVRLAILALRAQTKFRGNRPRSRIRPRPIAVVTDRSIAPEALMAFLQPDIVRTIPAKELTGSSVTRSTDLRVRKLVAYRHTPFERTIFFDGDTHVRSYAVAMLFETLDHFELAAAFECCRRDYNAMSVPYDPNGFMRGWEMQTGVMAMRRSKRLEEFW